MNSDKKPLEDETKYILRREMLQVGDVICTREDTPTSNLIRKILSCDYSHVLLCIAESSCIHADADGVHSLNTQRLLLDGKDDFKVLRPKAISPDSIKKVIQYARIKIGTEYSKFDAGKSGLSRKLKTPLKIESQYQFCSRLVAEAFRSGGMNFPMEPSLCTPADILESNHFDEVTDVVRAAEFEEVKFSEDDSKNSILKQSLITNKILSSARELFKTKEIQNFEDLLRWVIKIPEHDTAVSEIIINSGYLTMWADDVIKNPNRYFKTNYPSAEVRKILSVEGLNYELKIAKSDLHRYDHSRIEHLKLYKNHEFETFFQLVNLYQTLVSLALQRIELFTWLLRKKSEE